MKKLREMLTNPAMILRLGGGTCFIAHGLLALAGKAGFVELLGTFGFMEGTALPVLQLIGCVDVLVGVTILFRPNRFVLRWAMAWTALTIVAWGFHGDSLADLARRATYLTTPLALLLLLEQGPAAAGQTGSNPDQQRRLVPVQIQGAIPFPVLSEAQRSAVNTLDLSMICKKIMHSEGWTPLQCAEVSEEYRRFLVLKLLFPNEPVVPNKAIDTLWHYHILDTAAYQRDCQAIFGGMLHHYPYFGMQGKSDRKTFVNAFERTKQLYVQVFGETMDREDFLASFRMARSA